MGAQSRFCWFLKGPPTPVTALLWSVVLCSGWDGSIKWESFFARPPAKSVGWRRWWLESRSMVEHEATSLWIKKSMLTSVRSDLVWRTMHIWSCGVSLSLIWGCQGLWGAKLSISHCGSETCSSKPLVLETGCWASGAFARLEPFHCVQYPQLLLMLHLELIS